MRRVDPSVYTKEYYLTDATGHEEFKETFGNVLEVRFRELVKMFEIKPDMRVLDIGCGRGEMVLYAVKHGAYGVGIDYATYAIALANKMKAKHSADLQKRMKFIEMDAKKLNFTNSSFDMVILTDVVEHLYPEELDVVFRQIKRVLKKNGLLVIHTAPNRWFNDYTYTYYCHPISTLLVSIWNKVTGRKYPDIAKPEHLRVDSHSIMHINEPTYFSLLKLFRKFGFSGKIMSTNVTAKKQITSVKDVIFNFIVFLHPVSTLFPINIFFGSDFVSILQNRK